MSPSVSVVIPARNAAATLATQLEALMMQEYDGDLQIIVVDNGSSDDTRAVAESYESGRWPVRVVHESIAGLNRARNAGVSSATGEYVLLCDADDVVAANWVRELAGALADADLVGGVVETASMNSPTVREMWGVESSHRPQRRYVGFESPWGCNCGFRRAAWQSVGGFDPELSYVIDEIEFFVRAQLAGFQLAFAEGAIVHYRLRDDPSSVLRRRYQNGIGEVLLAARHGTAESRLILLKSAARGWASLAIRAFPALFGGERRWVWKRVFARRAGRLVGSIRYRVIHP